MTEGARTSGGRTAPDRRQAIQSSRIRVAVVMGGPSAEREVSLASGRCIVAALPADRYEAVPVEVSRDGRWMLHAGVEHGDPRLSRGGGERAAESERGLAVREEGLGIDRVVEGGRPDLVLLAMHGPFGEDGTVQGLLELAGIPYTGSGVLASALAMDKLRSRQLFGFNGIPVPAYLAVDQIRFDRDAGGVASEAAATLGFPCVVKPNALGSSIGVSIARTLDALPAALAEAFRFDTLVLVEEYLRGTEVTCAVLEDPAGNPTPLPLVEIVPKREFFTYEAKYTAGACDEICPARLPADVTAAAQAQAVRAHQVLGCRDVSRVDMVIRNGQAIVLEVNTIPGMTENSLLPKTAAAAGLSFPALLERMIALALNRRRPAPAPEGRR